MQRQIASDFFTTITDQKDEFSTFAEDYEPVKAFFSGEQKGIFDQTLAKIEIYEDSKEYIADKELGCIVEKMAAITSSEEPYSAIHELPGLCEQFTNIYQEILAPEHISVTNAIERNRDRVLDALDGKEYASEIRDDYEIQFQDILDNANKCTSISVLRGCSDRADVLSNRLLNEISEIDAETDQSSSEDHEPSRKRTIKNYSIWELTGTKSWHLKNVGDVDTELEILRENLLSKLDGTTTINVKL